VINLNDKVDKILKEKMNINSLFLNQKKAIDFINSGMNVFLIEKTGFGKSLIYQYLTLENGGLTIVFSPLKALMRDQMKAALKLGLRVAAINSDNFSYDNKVAIEKAANGEIDIIFISPERYEDVHWMNMIEKMDIKLFVIDEAHCVSVWGHDFRPAYRRIVEVFEKFENVPILALTATANKRVQKDIMKQLKKGEIIQGNLMRENLSLNVIKAENEREKMIYMYELIKRSPGTGIVYTGTIHNTVYYSKWLNFNGIRTLYYNSKLSAHDKLKVEKLLMENKIKCVVATNSLGMGLNKKDLRFIIHTQIPSSPTHYYQEIGRAGRDGKKSYIFLLHNYKDSRLQFSFINNSKPEPKFYKDVLEFIDSHDFISFYDIKNNIDLDNLKLYNILNDFIDLGAIERFTKNSDIFYKSFHRDNRLNLDFIEKLRDVKISELKSIIRYCSIDSCRMSYLINYLDGEEENICNICDNDKDIKYRINFNIEHEKLLNSFFNKNINIINLKSIDGSYTLTKGIRKSFEECKIFGMNYSDKYYKDSIKFLKNIKWIEEIDFIFYVPSNNYKNNILKNFVEKLSKGLKIEFCDDLKKIKKSNKLSYYKNLEEKKKQVHNSFLLENKEKFFGKNILIIDDFINTGITITEIINLFKKVEVNKIYTFFLSD
jgi:ATP-dependent DNA helicase RecQ